MAFISICLLIIVIFVIVSVSKKTKDEESLVGTDGKWKKVGISMLLFIPFFVGYYMLVAIIICIPLGITMVAGQVGWVYGIIGGIAISPILAVLTIYKIVWKK